MSVNPDVLSEDLALLVKFHILGKLWSRPVSRHDRNDRVGKTKDTHIGVVGDNG